MREAVEYLLPAIPNVLYGGLGRHQVEQLTSLRRTAAQTWETHAGRNRVGEFPALFQDVLAGFDGDTGSFSLQRVQDELIGQMSDLLGVAYDTLAAEIFVAEKHQKTRQNDVYIKEKESSSKKTNDDVSIRRKLRLLHG
jgi:hypothetical protein